ncbi:MAG: methyltransferase domain-containing protein [Kiritimatiellae bacterium]|nr:methyltransferase domain-containing protein [Kiritimatiellia bacterium]
MIFSIIKQIGLVTAPLWDPIYIQCYKWVKKHRGPIPPLQNRKRVGNWPIGRFLNAGYEGYKPIKHAIESHYSLPFPELKILDFGAGVGRTLQYFHQHNPAIYATDVDLSATTYLKRAFPEAHIKSNHYEPPLTYPNDFFDVIYSVSIWTHLHPKDQIPWLEELKRIAKPGALVCVTTSGFKALHLRQKRDQEWKHITDQQLDEEGLIYREYPSYSTEKKEFPGITRSYGLTAHTPSYILKNWSTIFMVLDMQEAVIDHIQDLIIMKKA